MQGIGGNSGPDAYQVTGEVVEVNETVIVVLKGKERFEIARGTVETAAKVGQKVKVEYKMTATSIEVKEATPKKK